MTSFAPPRFFGALVALLLALTGASALSAQERPGRQAHLTPSQLEELRTEVQELGGRVIVGFKPARAAEGLGPAMTPLLRPAEVRALAEELLRDGLERVVRQHTLIPAVTAVIDPAAIEALLADPRVDYVEPDRLVEPHVIEGAPAAAAQTVPWGIDRIGAATAWATTRGAGASIGIIDTGIDSDHPDLNPLGGINLVTGGTTAADWDDASDLCGSHGTHVAGSAAALDNTEGVVGVAPEAELYALRIFDPEADGISGCFAFTSNRIAAIEWAVTNGLDVVNMSVGSSVPSLASADASAAAAAQGLILVASSGNSGSFGVGFPAGEPAVIAVAASDEHDYIAYFSSRGPEVDVAAPGVNVLSTTNDGGTDYKNGTSMASPHVAGLATLIRAANGALTPAEVRSILRTTATDIAAPGFDNEAGFGLVDAAVATSAAGADEFALAAVPVGVEVDAAAGATSSVSASVELRSVGAAGSVAWSASTDQTWLTVSPTSGSVADGSPATLTVTADPTSLEAKVHRGFVTVDGTFAGGPLSIPVRFSVQETIALDATVETRARLALEGDRKRFVFTGTAGQRVDVAVLSDTLSSFPLWDPVLRIYMPDGVTVLASNDDAWFAFLGYQSLVWNLELPVDGDYVAEVAGWGDFVTGDFIVKARPAGPILGIRRTDGLLLGGGQGFGSFGLRGPEGGAAATADLEIVNLSGVGTLEWSAETDQPWLSLSPTSGTATTSALVAGAPEAAALFTKGEDGSPEHVLRDAEPADLLGRDGLERIREILGSEFAESAGAARATTGASGVTGVSPTPVTLSADPASLAQGEHYGGIYFETGWLSPEASAYFRVFAAGFAFMSPKLPFIGLTTDNPLEAIGVTLDVFTAAEEDGDFHPVDPEGVVGAAVVTNARPYPMGVTRGADANWYLGTLIQDPVIKKVARDGVVSDFAQTPQYPIYLATGPDGELYVSDWWEGQVFRVSADGSAVEPFGPPIQNPAGLTYNPTDESLYVISAYNDDLVRIGLADGVTETVLTYSDVPCIWNVVAGRSGALYLADYCYGRIFAFDPATATVEMLGWLPSWVGLPTLALLEGRLMVGDYIAGFGFIGEEFHVGEGYVLPVADGPVTTGNVTARMAGEQVDAIRGETFTVPLVLRAARGVAGFDLSLQWSPAQIAFESVAEGTFGGTLTLNTDGAVDGVLHAAAAREDNVFGDVTILSLTFASDPEATPGENLVAVQFDDLSDASAANLLEFLEVDPGGICVETHVFGDVTRDGTLGSGDAVQVLRGIVGLPLTDGADLALADVDRDGTVGIADPIQILRYLVEFPIPETSRIDRYGIGECR